MVSKILMKTKNFINTYIIQPKHINEDVSPDKIGSTGARYETGI